jgi:hypothetical protein
MATNSIGTLSGTLVLQRALQLTFLMFPQLRAMAMGFNDMDGVARPALLNQPVKSRILGLPTVNAFGTGASNTTTTDVSVTLDTALEVHQQFLYTEYMATDRNLLDEQAKPIAIAIAKKMMESARDQWVETNFPNTDTFHAVTVASGWTRSNTVNVLAKNGAKVGLPEMERFQALNADVYYALLDDTTIVAALNNPDNAGAIKSGRLPMVSDFGLALYPSVTVGAGASISITSADTATEIITCSAAHGLVTGQRVNLTIVSGLTGLTTATSYYVIYVAATTFKLATTAANAAAGTAINITADGTGSVIDSRIGFAGTPDATIFLARALQNPSDVAPGLSFPGNSGYVINPENGFQVLVQQWIDTATNAVNNRISWAQGFAKGNPNNGIILYKN